MKGLLRHFIAETLALYLISRIFTGMVFDNGYQTLLLTGAVLMIFTIVVKPIINILILPINLVTFGFFKWVTSVIAIYIVALIVPGFHIVSFAFAGFSSKWIDLPSFSFGGFLAYLAFSFAISIFSSIVIWLVK